MQHDKTMEDFFNFPALTFSIFVQWVKSIWSRSVALKRGIWISFFKCQRGWQGILNFQIGWYIQWPGLAMKINGQRFYSLTTQSNLYGPIIHSHTDTSSLMYVLEGQGNSSEYNPESVTYLITLLNHGLKYHHPNQSILCRKCTREYK